MLQLSCNLKKYFTKWYIFSIYIYKKKTMFSIIKNYKNLFLSFTKNNFAWWVEKGGNNQEEVKDTNNNWTNIDELVSKMLSDNRIDWKDKDYIKQLQEQLESDKNDIYKQTKEKTKIIMKDIYNDLLDKGYTIKNPSDRETLKWLMKISWTNLPKEVNINSLTSIYKSWENIYLTWRKTWVNWDEIIWKIDKNWKFTNDISNYEELSNLNSSYNDNEIEAYQRVAAISSDIDNDNKAEAAKKEAEQKLRRYKLQ